MPVFDSEMCHYVEEGGRQCEKPASIHIRVPAPEPYSHLMMDMWLCADHYDMYMASPWGTTNDASA